MTITFQGQGLEALANESWGVDNVRVTAASDAPPTTVSQTSPGAGERVFAGLGAVQPHRDAGPFWARA